MNITSFSKMILVSTFIINFQSCDTQGSVITSSTQLNMVQQLMTASTNQSFSIVGNTNSFLTNALVEKSLPNELKQINSKLVSLGLSSLVDKEKQYIGKAAEASVTVAKPIISSAIQDLTLADAISIISGGKGAATQYLKSKTESKLVTAIQPQVENQLNSNGITLLIANATKDKTLQNAINVITGNKQSSNTDIANSISKYAAQQIVDGLFEISKDYEINNYSITKYFLNKALNSNNK